jgi:hypothetical protein
MSMHYFTAIVAKIIASPNMHMKKVIKYVGKK